MSIKFEIMPLEERLDIEMTERGLVQSRGEAQRLIENKRVRLNGVVETRSHKIVKEGDETSVDFANVFVSRGGDKLKHALDSFKISVKDFVCLDVGSSTGGFTDCLIQNGASKVYSVDVGKDQLIEKLKKDKRVVSIEKTDIRKIESLPELVDLIVMDVSFISVTKILSFLKKFLKEKGQVVLLIKPQFEIVQNKDRKGKINDEKLVEEVIENIKKEIEKEGYMILGLVESPILGKKGGNTEYLVYFERK
jgi:23S rRNA (cytidine1920-2'-O)/16S rRNA (cytidine1409-2'-O)-methyltransferase